MIKSLRNAFFSGVLLLAPVGVTLFVFNFLIQTVGAPMRRILFFFIPASTGKEIWFEYGLYISAMLVVVLAITFLGWLSKLLIGRLIVGSLEGIISGVPVVNFVYNTVKQIRDTFVQQQKAVFQESVLIEYPREGVFVLGFLTGGGKGEPQHKTDRHLLNIFVPTTPNPTSGFLLMVPEDEVIPLEMSISDGMKLIISGGAVVPEYPPPVKLEPDAEQKQKRSRGPFGGRIRLHNGKSGSRKDDESDPPPDSST